MIICNSNFVELKYNVYNTDLCSNNFRYFVINYSKILLAVETLNIPLLLKLSFSINNNVFKIFRIFIVYNKLYSDPIYNILYSR